MSKTLKDKVIWICGASTGIGKSLATELIQKGARLCISSRDGEVIEDFEGRVKKLKCDVRQINDWRACAVEIKRDYGHLDMFIYNAGDCIYVDNAEINNEDFLYIMDINFHGMVRAAEVVLPLLHKSTEPRFVGMTSSVSWLPLPRAEAYGSSKAAASYFLRSLRLDLSTCGVQVTEICPGFVKTPMTDKNDFPMPFLVSAKEAGRKICLGLTKGKDEIHFPKRFTWVVKFLSHLPYYFQFKACRSFVR